MWSGSFKLGTAAECKYERPDYSQALEADAGMNVF